MTMTLHDKRNQSYALSKKHKNDFKNLKFVVCINMFPLLPYVQGLVSFFVLFQKEHIVQLPGGVVHLPVDAEMLDSTELYWCSNFADIETVKPIPNR